MNPKSSLASSLIMSLFHSGSKTTFTFTVFTSGMPSSFCWMSSRMKSAAGQLGAVKVMSMSMSKPSSPFPSSPKGEVLPSGRFPSSLGESEGT